MAFLKLFVRVVLVCLFVFAGAVKLVPNISQELYEYLVNEYIACCKIINYYTVYSIPL